MSYGLGNVCLFVLALYFRHYSPNIMLRKDKCSRQHLRKVSRTLYYKAKNYMSIRQKSIISKAFMEVRFAYWQSIYMFQCRIVDTKIKHLHEWFVRVVVRVHFKNYMKRIILLLYTTEIFKVWLSNYIKWRRTSHWKYEWFFFSFRSVKYNLHTQCIVFRNCGNISWNWLNSLILKLYLQKLKIQITL